jgi:PPM family protein phosphatase
MDRRSNHPMKNLMTRCLGLDNSVPEVSVSNEVMLHPGDIVLLCSDGLYEPLDDMLIGSMMLEGRLGDALNKIAECAETKSYPNSDNTSGVAIQIMSLQLISKAIPDTIDKQVDRSKHVDPVENAIDVIEQTFRLYEQEMNNKQKQP